MNMVTPGMFRLRGMLLLERHCAQMFIIRKESNSDHEALASLKPGLAEAVTILSWEPPNTPEGAKAITAKKLYRALDLQLAKLQS